MKLIDRILRFGLLAVALLAPLLTCASGYPLIVRKPQFFDSNGNVLTRGTLEVYLAGSSTPEPAYSDGNVTTPAGTTFTPNSRGEPTTPLFARHDKSYKFVLKDALGVSVYMVDAYQVTPQPFYDRTAAEIVAGVTPSNYTMPEFNVGRYGAVGDGVTDDTLAIRRAQSVLDAAGGGTLEFGQGRVYLLSTVSTTNVVVPVVTATFGPGTESHQYHVLIQNRGNIRWNLNGSRLKSTITNGGEMFILDGVRNFEVCNGEIESVTAKNGSGTVTTAGMNGFGVTSQTRDSYNIKFKNIVATNVFAPVYVFGDAASSFRVRGIVIDNLRHSQGIYTLAFHDNGDNVSARGVQSINTLRDYFIYGVSNHDVQMYAETGTAGFTSLIKAYDRDTTQIRLKLRTRKNLSQPHVVLQVQHAPAVQATPKRLIGIDLDINNAGTSSGVAVAFEYYRDSTLTATSTNNLWTGIRLRGIHEQAPTVSSTQNTLTAAGTLNTDGVVLLNGSLASIYRRTGLIDSKQVRSTFTPTLRINGATTGITYGAASAGEYWRDGQWVELLARVVLTSKGAGVGNVTFDLPIQASNTNAVNALVEGFAIANMAGLTSTIGGFVSLGGTTLTLQDQGAAGAANINDTNLTNTSEFFLHVRYPL